MTSLLCRARFKKAICEFNCCANVCTQNFADERKLKLNEIPLDQNQGRPRKCETFSSQQQGSGLVSHRQKSMNVCTSAKKYCISIGCPEAGFKEIYSYLRNHNFCAHDILLANL